MPGHVWEIVLLAKFHSLARNATTQRLSLSGIHPKELKGSPVSAALLVEPGDQMDGICAKAACAMH
jgi:hypothetical protein